MIAKLLPVILLIIGVGAGIGAGIMLAPAPAPEVAKTGDEMGDDIDHSEDEEAAHDDEDVDMDALGPNKNREYIKIANQFVVPVVERDSLSSLVVISLSLEAKSG